MLILSKSKIYEYAAAALIFLLGILVLLTFRHYGITWDEEVQDQYGQAVFDYYASGFIDHRFEQMFNLYLYGGMFDGLAAFLNAYTPIGIYETRHLLNACFGLLGLWGTWRLGRLIKDRPTGLLAMVFLALTPMYYGHMFNNPKDIPFAVGIVWTLYYMAKSIRTFPHISPSLILKLGIIFGLTLGVRVGGIMVLGYWGFILLLLSLMKVRRNKAQYYDQIIALGKLTLPVGFLAYSVMLLCWPWAQEAPLENPIRALIEFSNFPQDVEVLLNGTIYRSTELPWFYLPLYFAIQLPLMQLVLILGGLILLPWIWWNLNTRSNRFALGLVLLTAFMPMLYATISHPALYDAVRHFIFTLPPLCILAALAARFLYSWAIAAFEQVWSRRAVAIGMFTVFGISASTQIFVMRQLHPYEYIYANTLTNGVQGAYGKYELDYWGSSFKEAASKLQEFVKHEGGVPPGKIYRVAICGPWSSAMIYLPLDYEPVEADKPAEFFLSTTRWLCQDMRTGREIIRVERMGVPLSIVKDLRHENP